MGFKLSGNIVAMTYTIGVVVKGGEAAVSLSGDVPDGTYDIAGNEDQAQRTMTATRRLPDGRYAEQASHTHYKAE